MGMTRQPGRAPHSTAGGTAWEAEVLQATEHGREKQSSEMTRQAQRPVSRVGSTSYSDSFFTLGRGLTATFQIPGPWKYRLNLHEAQLPPSDAGLTAASGALTAS